MLNLLKKTALLFCIAIILNRCCSVEYQFKWVGFNTCLLDNSGIETIKATSDSVKEKALGLRIIFKDSIWSLAYQKIGLSTPACATTCRQTFSMVNSMSAIKIYTVYDLSQSYPANSEVTSLFLARYSQNVKSNYLKLSEIISDLSSSNRDQSSMEAFDLFLFNQEKMKPKCRFKIEISFSDHTILNNETTDIVLY